MKIPNLTPHPHPPSHNWFASLENLPPVVFTPVSVPKTMCMLLDETSKAVTKLMHDTDAQSPSCDDA